MTAVITGDIVNSRLAKGWMDYLKQVLNHYGKFPVNWEIFRGDSFQLTLSPDKALIAAFHIKAAIKQIPSLDVRMGIGIGAISHESPRVTESNGQAFVFSGECFETLKKQNLALRTDHMEMDFPLNIMLNLALLTANNWTSTVAQVIKIKMEYPNQNQKEIARVLDKSQSSISEALKRGGFDEIMSMNDFFLKKVPEL